MSERSNLDGPGETGAKVSFSNEHYFMAVLRDTARSTYGEDTDEAWNVYARAGIAIYNSVHRWGIQIKSEGEADCGFEEAFS